MSQTHLRYFDGMLRSRWLKSRGQQLMTIHHLYFTACRQRARVLAGHARAATVMKNGISQNCRLGGIKAVRRRQLIAARKGLFLSEYPGWFGSGARSCVSRLWSCVAADARSATSAWKEYSPWILSRGKAEGGLLLVWKDVFYSRNRILLSRACFLETILHLRSVIRKSFFALPRSWIFLFESRALFAVCLLRLFHDDDDFARKREREREREKQL
jgi:hypothetical protein